MHPTNLQLGINLCAELSFFRRRQVRHVTFPIDREEPNLLVVSQEIVDDSKTTSFALPAFLVTPAELAKSARAGHHRTRFGVLRQIELKRQKLVRVKIPVNVSREGRRFEELHSNQVYASGVSYAIRV